jgi:hydroxymethylglutaryl-CoA lyase
MEEYSNGPPKGMDMPKEALIIDVGPRDGFQNVKDLIPTEIKLRVIEAIADAGVKEMEITSFVHPKAVPQMADAMEVAREVVGKYKGGFRMIALVPNVKGAENAAKCGVNDVTYVISASESHNKANVNKTVDESLDDLNTLSKAYPQLFVRLSVATSFGCPFEKTISEEAVLKLVERAVERGVREVTLCDTIGVANPVQVMKLVKKTKEILGGLPLALHMHDTRGMGLANTLAGLIAGVARFETSVGGLGGCPFAPGASGNTASEDTINMMREMGIATGIDLEKYMRAVTIVKDKIQRDLSGHLGNVRSI